MTGEAARMPDGAARTPNGIAALTGGLTHLWRRVVLPLGGPAVALVVLAVMLALCAWASTT